MLRITDVANLLCISTAMVYRMVSSGTLPACRIGRVLRIRREDLEQFLRGAMVQVEERTPRPVHLKHLKLTRQHA